MKKLHVVIDRSESFDEETNTFVYTPALDFYMEHSLYTISEWESKTHKSFFRKNISKDEILDYICYTVLECIDNKITKDELLFCFLQNQNKYKEIIAYMDDPMTATYFRESNNRPNNETITSELIYYQMIKFQVPTEFQHWHINKLMALIKVITVKETPPKKRSMLSIMSEYDRINNERKKKLGTKG